MNVYRITDNTNDNNYMVRANTPRGAKSIIAKREMIPFTWLGVQVVEMVRFVTLDTNDTAPGFYVEFYNEGAMMNVSHKMIDLDHAAALAHDIADTADLAHIPYGVTVYTIVPELAPELAPEFVESVELWRGIVARFERVNANDFIAGQTDVWLNNARKELARVLSYSTI